MTDFADRKRERPKAEVAIEVPFHDVDALGVVWHGHIYKYLEIARTELFRLVELEPRPGKIEKTGRDENNFSLRVVETRCRHLMPLRYGDQLKVRAWFRAIDEQIHVAYDVLNETRQYRAARARTTLVVVDARGKLVTERDPERVAQMMGERL